MLLIIAPISFLIGIVLATLVIISLSLSNDEKFTPIVLLYSATMLITLAALILSLWQGFITQKHNKLSVRPKLMAEKHVYGEERRVELSIRNVGFGPANIQLFKIYLDGNLISFNEPSDAVRLANDLLRGLKNIKSGLIRVRAGTVIQPGETIKILESTWDKDDQGRYPSTHSLWSSLDERLEFEITFQSIYEEEETYQKLI